MYLFAADCRFFHGLDILYHPGLMGGRSFGASRRERLARTLDLYLWGPDSGIYLFLVQEGVPQR